MDSSPSADHPFPFSLLQYSRLLALRGRLQDGAYPDDRSGRYAVAQHQCFNYVERDGSTYFHRPMEPN